MTWIRRLFLLALWSLLYTGTEANCPPSDFDATPDVDLDSFISERWYSIKQKEVFYQPRDEFYCVYAEYKRRDDFCLFCQGAPRISVFNRSLRGSVSGSENTVNFRAIIPRPDDNAGKAFVGPTFIPYAPSLLFGLTNYWIVDVGTDQDALDGTSFSSPQYDWAIITAGPIDENGNDGKCVAGGGMWIFHRSSRPDLDVIKAIDERAAEYGIDTSQWFFVEHEGCAY